MSFARSSRPASSASSRTAASRPTAPALRSGAAGRTRDVVLNFGEEMYRSFGELLHTVRTGEAAFDSVYGAPLFEYYATNPEVEASAAARMMARTLPVARDLAASDVADRCQFVEGDFFSSVPAGGHVYVLKSVLHDWDDQRCVAILRNCRAAMDEAARLVIVELILPEHMTPSGPALSAALLDLIMLAHAGGRERTEAEFRQLLDQASLRLARTTELSAGTHLLEAVAV